MEEDYFLSLSASKQTIFKKKIGQHHFLQVASCKPIPNMQVGGGGLSHLSALISRVQRLSGRKRGQR